MMLLLIIPAAVLLVVVYLCMMAEVCLDPFGPAARPQTTRKSVARARFLPFPGAAKTVRLPL